MKTKSKKHCIICSLLLFYPLFSGVSSFKFIISPPIANLTLRPGEIRKIDLTIYNQGDQKLNLAIRTGSLEMDKKGNALASDKTNDPFSCANWLKLAEDNLIIEPHSKKVVSVEVKVPYGATGGKYGIVLFQTAARSASSDEIILIGRMGTIFMIEVNGPKKIEGSIKGFKIDKEDGAIYFIANIQNTGNVHFKIKGSVIIKDKLDKVVDRVNLNLGTGTILPDHEREFAGEWKNKGKMVRGKYKAILQILIPGQGATLQEIRDFAIN